MYIYIHIYTHISCAQYRSTAGRFTDLPVWPTFDPAMHSGAILSVGENKTHIVLVEIIFFKDKRLNFIKKQHLFHLNYDLKSNSEVK